MSLSNALYTGKIKMWNRIRFAILALSLSFVTACNSTQAVYQIGNLAQQGQSTIVISVNDKIIVNASADRHEWWVLYAGKNTNKSLSFDLYNNKRQHTLTFSQPGEYEVTTIKKSSTGQLAQFRRTLTFVVN